MEKVSLDEKMVVGTETDQILESGHNMKEAVFYKQL